MTILRLILFGLFGLLALTWLPSDSRAQGPQDPCSCKAQDKLDLEERIKKLVEADKEYDNLIKHWQQQPKTMLKESLRTAEQGKVNTAMAKIKTPGATRYSGTLGGTDVNCESWISDEAPLCLRRALKDHEAKHKTRCDAHKDPENELFVELLSGSADWRDKQTIVDYLKEEKADHQGEIAIYQSELKKMQNNCKQFTELDRSEKMLLEQALAQRERLDQAEKRVSDYGQSLS